MFIVICRSQLLIDVDAFDELVTVSHGCSPEDCMHFVQQLKMQDAEKINTQNIKTMIKIFKALQVLLVLAAFINY